MIKTKIEILEKLPKTAEAHLHNYDSAVLNFVELLRRTDDPMTVIDEMFIYYTKVLHHQQDMISKMIPYFPVKFTVPHKPD